jgi:hypothetical protein
VEAEGATLLSKPRCGGVREMKGICACRIVGKKTERRHIRRWRFGCGFCDLRHHLDFAERGGEVSIHFYHSFVLSMLLDGDY